jgi:hypothetical protein
MARTATPPPGPVGIEYASGTQTASLSPFTYVADGAAAGVDLFGQALATLESSDSWLTLRPLVMSLMGPQTFGLGVIYGAGENIIGGVLGLAQLAKTFLLADLYDRATRPGLMAYSSPLTGPFQNLLADFSMRMFREALEAAHTERDQLIAELRYAIANPLEVLGNIGADYADKWRRFEGLITQQSLSSQFEAGRIFGEVLMDVLMVIGTGVAVAKAASKIPRLLKLATSRFARTTPAAGSGAATAGAGAVTPSGAVAAGTTAARPVAVRPPLKTKPMRDIFKGEDVPGNTVWPGTTVKYLNDTERAAYQLQFKNGRIYDANGKLFDTSTAQSAHTGGGNAIFVMDAEGNFFASKTQVVGEFHHSSLAAGQPVAAAGELRVEQGVLKHITDQSGHYRPTTDLTAQALDALESQGIDTSRVTKTIIGRPPGP